MYIPHPIKTIDAEQEQPSYYKRAKKRDAIYNSAGDLETLVGTLNDAVHVLLVGFIDLVTQLKHASSLAEIRTASESLQQRFNSIAQKIENKSLQFPFQIKTIEEVLHEIIKRSQAITDVFIAAQATQATAQPIKEHDNA